MRDAWGHASPITKKSETSNVWAIRKRERAGKRGEREREEMAAPAIFWMSPSPTPVHGFLCTFFWIETEGGACAQLPHQIHSGDEGGLHVLAFPMLRRSGAGAAVRGEGQTTT
jgi:hypothetical protein